VRRAGKRRVYRVALAFVSLITLLDSRIPSQAYSVLTHEQIVDIAWKDEIQPILQKRFPAATAEDLRTAHAFAYGGCLIQDIGYYPFGSKFFSDLTHYVRSGDFVSNLIRESSNLNDYAFALGALAHYTSDVSAHPTINRCVALSYPKLRAKYGESVTYADCPKAHIRVEFGFDMVQVAKNRYTSDRFHDFIGFEVSQPVLERAMRKTYGLSLEDTLGAVDLAIGTFRRAVSRAIPQITHMALIARRPEIVKDDPNFSQKKFLYNLSRSQYEKEWGKGYRRPGLGTRMLAVLLKFIPKIGPAQALGFKIPSSDTEDLYIRSVNRTVDKYRDLLRKIESGTLELADTDLDTAEKPHAGEYILSDRAYARLLDELAKHPLEEIRPDLRQNILDYYTQRSPLRPTRKDRKAWCKTVDELWTLNSVKSKPGDR